jgi:hypothetical protein
MGGAGAGANSRSSGWSKYFANDHSTSALGARKGSISSARSTESNSLYTRGSGATYPSQTVQPLEINLGPKFGEGTLVDGRPVSRVATGSPVLGHSRDHSAHGGQTAELARTISHKSGKSTLDSSTWGDFHSDTLGGGTATTNTWTPVSDTPGWNTTPLPSRSNNNKPSPHQNTFSVASSVYSRAPQSSYYPAYDDRRNLYTAQSSMFPMPPGKGSANNGAGGDNRDSAATLWPRPAAPDSPGLPPLPKQYVGAGSGGNALNGGGAGGGKYGYNQGMAQKKAPVGDDVSWLNLGGNAGSAY